MYIDTVGGIDGACGGRYDGVSVGDDATDLVDGIGGTLDGEAATGTGYSCGGIFLSTFNLLYVNQSSFLILYQLYQDKLTLQMRIVFLL